MNLMQQFRQSSKPVWLAIMVFLMPVLVQFAQALPLRGDEQGGGWSYGVICTRFGPVAPGDLQTPFQEQNKGSQSQKNSGLFCPVCLSFSVGCSTIIPGNWVVVSYAPRPQKEAAKACPFNGSQAIFHANAPRGPPPLWTV